MIKIKNTTNMERIVADWPYSWPIGHVLLALKQGFCRRVWRNVGDNFSLIEELETS
jgi:hypothetical protein